MRRQRRRRRKRPPKKLDRKMRAKLVALFSVIVVLLCALVARLTYIEYTSGDKYEKKVLSQMSYDSQTLPYQRGDIVDANGTILATSEAVYNVILDCSVMTYNEDYIEPTIDALVTCFPDLDRDTLEGYARDRADSKYIVLETKLSYDEIQPFVNMQNEVDENGNSVNPYINGVWFEKEYQRTYPYGTLAASVIGFTSDGNVGTTGLENYYDDVLNGVNGREYGYLNSDSDFEKTVIAAQDGDTLVCSIDANIQSIVEEKIEEFNELYRDNYRDGAGSTNTAVVVMDPNTGYILAMADYPEFDLNNPRDLSSLYSEEELSEMTDSETLDILNGLWQNYCISSTYEPGSVQKPCTVAAGLETGTITDDMTFFCDGGEMFDRWISCVSKNGHGLETVRGALMDSCNDSLMQMSYKIGAENFVNYQSIFGFGAKTGIDLPGEANTASLVYTLDDITAIDLATNAFGQNFNCTMIQMISAYCSLINGGTYYQPQIVKKITDSEGNTIETHDPIEVKQTISESTSAQIKDYLLSVVAEGTGSTAQVDGYSMGGKTGTAEKLPRSTGNYLVSFMGFAPYDNPQVVIYCIVDEPNAADQAHSYFAMNIAREILEEVLPYMNIFPDEELTGANAGLDVTGVNAQWNGESSETNEAGESTASETVEGTVEETVEETDDVIDDDISETVDEEN
ncbi:MAG: penicillin-binding protein 2 [Clostridiales bacterium]|nr:penicillin-binding protein 2 [Clostridiales bacterium]